MINDGLKRIKGWIAATKIDSKIVFEDQRL